MNEAEFHRFKEEIDQRESQLDGSCKYERVFGMFPRHLMEKCQLMNWAGRKGKTRIVIEYNNDTGEGWKRVVSEDPEGIATHRCKTECQEYQHCQSHQNRNAE